MLSFRIVDAFGVRLVYGIHSVRLNKVILNASIIRGHDEFNIHDLEPYVTK